jgi:hypothetical protein
MHGKFHAKKDLSVFNSGPLLTYRLGRKCPDPPALLLVPPVGNFSLPLPPVRSLTNTCSRWSTSNYVSKWENDVKLLTFLNLTIICRPVTTILAKIMWTPNFSNANINIETSFMKFVAPCLLFNVVSRI